MNAQFKIEVEWLDNSEGLDDPAEKATASKIRIIIDEVNICRNDRGETIEWHALSIAEWVCENWERILFESKPPLPLHTDVGILYDQKFQRKIESLPSERTEKLVEQKFQWWKAHNLRGGRQGGAFPEIIFWPQGNRIGLSWLNDAEPFARTNIKFVAQPGHAYILLSDAVDQFKRFLEAVCTRLDVCEVQTDRANRFRESVRLLGSDYSKFKSILEYVGIGAPAFHELTGVSANSAPVDFKNPERNKQLWSKLNLKLGLGAEDGAPSFARIGMGSAPMALFRSSSPHLTVEDVHQLKKCCLDIPRNENARAKLIELAKKTEERLPAEPITVPYLVGYAKAKKFRSVLQHSANKFFDVERVISDQLQVKITTCELTDKATYAVSLWDANSGPSISVNKAAHSSDTSWGRRTALAHELCHLLFDSAYGIELGVASGPWAPLEIEQVANAFAAELLVPEAGLEQFDYRPLTPARLKKICDHYEVGHSVVAHRLVDLGKVSEDEAQRALDGLFTPGKSRRRRKLR